MVTQEELKKLEEQIKIINEKLKDYDLKVAMNIAYENFMYDSGFRPCNGTWDRVKGRCIPTGANTPPTVNAGEDRETTVSSVVTLVGEATDFENNIVFNGWAQTAGPLVNLSSTADGKTATFTPINAGIYGFTFTAKDSEGLVGTDSVVITVKDDGQGGHFNVNAGTDKTIKTQTLPVSVKLEGEITRTGGGDVSIKEFRWTSNPTIPVPTGSLTPIVTFNNEGKYVLTLTATDVTNVTKSDSVEITVVKEGEPGGQEIKLVPKSITASKEDSGKTAIMVSDGDFESRWSAAGKGEWIEFTFDKSYTITKVALTGYHYDKTYTFEIGGKTFTNNAGRPENTLIEYDLKDLNINSDKIRIVGQGNNSSTYNSFREIVFYGIGDGGPPPPPPPPGEAKAVLSLPSTAVPKQTNVSADARGSVGDTVEIKETTSEGITLKDTGDPLVKVFDIPDKNNFSIGIQAKAIKGTSQSVVQKAIQVSGTPPPPPDGFGTDAFGMKMLFKPTGKKVKMEKGTNHRNGQRYNVNHEYENYIMQGYYKLGKGQEKINHKGDGPNHGGCKTISKFQCLWYEFGVDLSNGKFELQYEMPHPDNHNVSDSKCEFVKSVGKLSPGNWIGWATAYYWGADGFRHMKAFVDPDPFDASGKPKNNWFEGIYAIEKGQIVDGIKIPRDMQAAIKHEAGLESEIRMHRATSGDTAMNNAWVLEIDPKA